MADSSSCSEVEVFQEDQTYWGKSKKNYYESEEESASGSEAEMLLEETIKIQKKQASLLAEQDFFDPESFNESNQNDSKTDLNNSDISGLLDELTSTLQLVSKKFDAPLEEVTAEKNKEISIFKPKEMSFESSKNSLLFNYAQNIVFYLFLKSQGIQTEGHPVIDHLVRVKLLLEKIKPLEIKLCSFTDKIVKSSEEGEKSGNVVKACKANLEEFLEDEVESNTEKQSTYKRSPCTCSPSASSIRCRTPGRRS